MKILALNNKVVIVNGKPLQIQDYANLMSFTALKNGNKDSSNSSPSSDATQLSPQADGEMSRT